MECKWLEDFLSVARTGSFSRSAAERHITQSAFSRRIKSLEQWAGGALIDRSTYPTRLTPAGERFRDVAEQAVSMLQEARLDLRATIDARGSTLRVAAPHALAGDFLTGWLGRVRNRLGDMPVEVRADNLHDCVRDLDEGNVDLLICHVHEALPIGIDAHRFPWTKIADTHLVPVSVPERAGRPRFSLRRRSPRPIPMLRYGSDSYLGRVAALILAQLALEHSLRVVYESALTESLRAAAVAGLGLAWLPRHFVQDDLEQGRLVHAGDARHDVPLAVRLHVNRARLEAGPAAALAHDVIA